jgi:hypothetical protein
MHRLPAEVDVLPALNNGGKREFEDLGLGLTGSGWLEDVGDGGRKW